MYSYPEVKDETEKKNREILFSLIKNHFAIREDSLDYIESQLHNYEVDDYFHNIVGETDGLRRYWKLENFQAFDEGWKHFINVFTDIIFRADITYENYRTSRIEKNKNILKLKNFMTDFYLKNQNSFCSDFKLILSNQYDKNYIENRISKELDIIGAKKLPKKNNISIVFSVNPVDMFLASSGETWNSCIGLNYSFSKNYWAGLPGLIGDKSRGMFYITDGQKKDYKGIVVDKLISRSFGILDDFEKISFLRWYPHSMISALEIEKTIGIKIETGDFFSKNPIVPIYHKGDFSSFIYQDDSKFVKKDGKFHIKSGNSGKYYIMNGEMLEGDTFEGKYDTFEGYYENNDSIKDDDVCLENQWVCDNCGGSFYEDEIISNNFNNYCEECYSDMFFICDDCGETFDENQSNEVGNSYFCNSCFEESYFFSDLSNEVFSIDEQRTIIMKGKKMAVALSEIDMNEYYEDENGEYVSYDEYKNQEYEESESQLKLF